MAQVNEREKFPGNIESGQQEIPGAPAGKSSKFRVIGSGVARRSMLTGCLGATTLALIAVLGCNSGSTGSAAEKPAATPVSAPATPEPKLSPSEIKEMQARDDYASRLTVELHAKDPAYKNVKIYADNWLGTKAPKRGPLDDIKARTGDNLMLVFWSPDPNTARSFTDFTKSRAAQSATNLGFEEFQFVDPGTYCYAQIATTGGIGPATCGIR